MDERLRTLLRSLDEIAKLIDRKNVPMRDRQLAVTCPCCGSTFVLSSRRIGTLSTAKAPDLP